MKPTDPREPKNLRSISGEAARDPEREHARKFAEENVKAMAQMVSGMTERRLSFDERVHQAAVHVLAALEGKDPEFIEMSATGDVRTEWALTPERIQIASFRVTYAARLALDLVVTTDRVLSEHLVNTIVLEPADIPSQKGAPE